MDGLVWRVADGTHRVGLGSLLRPALKALSLAADVHRCLHVHRLAGYLPGSSLLYAPDVSCRPSIAVFETVPCQSVLVIESVHSAPTKGACRDVTPARFVVDTAQQAERLCGTRKLLRQLLVGV